MAWAAWGFSSTRTVGGPLCEVSSTCVVSPVTQMGERPGSLSRRGASSELARAPQSFSLRFVWSYVSGSQTCSEVLGSSCTDFAVCTLFWGGCKPLQGMIALTRIRPLCTMFSNLSLITTLSSIFQLFSLTAHLYHEILMPKRDCTSVCMLGPFAGLLQTVAMSKMFSSAQGPVLIPWG